MEIRTHTHRVFGLAAASIVAITIAMTGNLLAQTAGEQAPGADGVITFTPVVPLIGEDSKSTHASQGAGANLLFSASGWALGGYYVADAGGPLSWSVDAFFTTRRNNDEFESFGLFFPFPVVEGKVSRVFNLPVSLSLRYRVFEQSLQETFRPYITVGATAAAVIVMPYMTYDAYDLPERFYDFFESFGYATTSIKPGGFIGVGSNFGSLEKGSTFSLSVRYFVIPYGEPGVESLRNLPMSNFNGLFISLSIGSMW